MTKSSSNNYSDGVSRSNDTTTKLLLFDVVVDPLQIGGLVGFILLIVSFQIMIAKAKSGGGTTAVSDASKRRFQHALTGHALVQISYILPYTFCIVALSIGIIGFLVARNYFPIWFYTTFGSLLRPEELSGKVLPGAVYFLVGTTLSAILTGEDKLYIARYAVECLAIADPIASYIGATISSPQLCKGSSLSGCIACFLTSFCVGFIMLGYTNSDGNTTGGEASSSSSTSWFVLVLGALACTISEAIPFGNDNLNIPIATTLTVLLATGR